MIVEADNEQFWQVLRRSVRAAERAEQEELEQAERLLAETEVESDRRLTPQQIAAMVARATAGGDDGEASEMIADEAVDPGLVAKPQPASVHRFARLQRVLAAAAALMVAPKFLAAATVVTVVAVVSYIEIRYSTQSLPYQDAVRIMMDERQSEQSRKSSQVRVASDLLESIGLVRAVSNEGGEIGPQARATLQHMRSLLADAEPFVMRRYSDNLVALGDVVADNTLDVEERQDALSRLDELMAYGLQALKAIELQSVPSLKASNAAHLAILANSLR